MGIRRKGVREKEREREELIASLFCLATVERAKQQSWQSVAASSAYVRPAGRQLYVHARLQKKASSSLGCIRVHALLLYFYNYTAVFYITSLESNSEGERFPHTHGSQFAHCLTDCRTSRTDAARECKKKRRRRREIAGEKRRGERTNERTKGSKERAAGEGLPAVLHYQEIRKLHVPRIIKLRKTAYEPT